MILIFAPGRFALDYLLSLERKPVRGTSGARVAAQTSYHALLNQHVKRGHGDASLEGRGIHLLPRVYKQILRRVKSAQDDLSQLMPPDAH